MEIKNITKDGRSVSEKNGVFNEELADTVEKVNYLYKNKIGIASIDEFEEFATKDQNGIVTDWTPAVQEIFNRGIRTVEAAGKSYTFRTTISIPYNFGPRFVGRSGLKRTVFNVFIPSGNEERAFIEYLDDGNGGYNHSGITIENIHIIGNDAICPLISNVLIERFNGAGLLIDKCQDGSFNNLAIQASGRSRGNGTVNEETVYSPLHIISSMPDDHNNMLRFRDIQIEENRVSPFIWWKDMGGISNVFENVHAEIRTKSDWYKWDFMLIESGDFNFSGINADRFREAFVFNGYGKLKFYNCRNIGNIHHTKPGVNATIEVNGCNLNNVTYRGINGQSRFNNSSIGNVEINYPDGDEDIFAGCIIGDFTVAHVGGGYGGVKVRDCVLNSYTTLASAKNQTIKDCQIIGNIEARAVNSTVENVTFGKELYIEKAHSSYIKKRKIIHSTAAPISGGWNTGDLVYNTKPSAGGFVGWVCVSGNGSGVGTWKGFGSIQS
jgi:hypothetical protein